jgi:DNA-binding beta-propeller fold protein YncE
MTIVRTVASLVPVLTLAGGVALAGGCSTYSITYGGPGFMGDDDAGCFGGCPVFDAGGPPVTHPEFGKTVQPAVAPPPISGGTLILLHDGQSVAAADPDRDAVYIVDLRARRLTVHGGGVRWAVALQAGDEPGRVIEDGAGRVHVALRGSGLLATIDPVAGKVLSRRSVCPAPRGVAWDQATDLVWVACATGELVALPASGGPAVHSYVLERDLRDVFVQNGSLVVSKFRSAQILGVTTDGAIASRSNLPDPDVDFESHVAWRTIAGPNGSIVVVHQGQFTQQVQTTIQGGYGGGSESSGPPSVVESVVTRLNGPGGSTNQTILGQAVLPVDVAVSSAGAMAVVAAGNAFVEGLDSVVSLDAAGGVGSGWSLPVGVQPTAVAYDAAGDVLVQTREPAGLYVLQQGTSSPGQVFGFSAPSRDDTGHDVFHTEAGGLIACASCHPEAGDDGFIWHLDGNTRRTPSLRGTIAGTAPYHWPGDQPNLDTLIGDVYTRRMNGATLPRDQLGALESWVERIPAPKAPSWVDSASAQRGQAIFERGDVGCTACHSGPKLTNNQTVNVGTGAAFQVPPLVGVGWRTPLLHDGCAQTLADRFGACATPQHGSIGSLSAQDVADLVAYLETL